MELRLILANGQAVNCSLTEEPDLFQAARCGLGALGVISTVTLRLEPAFRLRERRLTQSLERTLADLPELRASSEHFKFLWYPHTDDAVLFALDRTTQPIERPSSSYVQDQIVNHHLLESLLYVASFRPALVPAINRLYYNTQLRGQKSIRVDNSVDVFNFDCLFKQYVSEWAIPRYVCLDPQMPLPREHTLTLTLLHTDAGARMLHSEHAAAALRELKAFVDRTGFPAHFPVEVRFVAADDIWLSPAYGRPTCFIGIIMYRYAPLRGRGPLQVDCICVCVCGPVCGRVRARLSLSLNLCCAGAC